MVTFGENVIETKSCRYGLMSFFKNDTIISRSLKEYGEWAQAEIEFLLALVSSRDTVLDIGAFIGTHTLAFAKRVSGGGEVYAFEPQPFFFEVLKKNVSQNGMANVKLFNIAVSEEFSRAEICELDVRGAGDFAETSIFNGVCITSDEHKHYTIDVMTVDQLAIDRCDLIKIDAVNMGINILRGSRQTLRAKRPFVFAACNSLHYGWPVVEFMKEEGYCAYLLNVPAYNINNFRQNVNNFLNDGREAGLIFIPRERLSRVQDQLDQLHRLPSFIPVATLDDLALGLLKKPQYKYEVMSKSDAARVLGIEFWANETEVGQFRNDAKALQGAAERMREEMARFQVTIRSQQEALAQREEKITQLATKRKKLADDLTQMQATLRAQLRAAQVKEAQVTALFTERENLSQEVNQLRVTAQHQQQAISTRDATLSHIYNSHGWKALSVYYKLRDKLLPQGTWQRAFAKCLFRSIRNLRSRFLQQAQFDPGVAVPQEEHKEVATRQIVQELMTSSSIKEVSNWEDYEYLSARISALRQTRLEGRSLKPPKMVCIDEKELSTYAKSLSFTANNQVQVSIVIPVYNNLKFTLECLTSVMQHSTGVAYEVVVVDDGSSDQTPEVLSRLANITYIRNEKNLGFVHTCNRGAEIARGKYILFLNNDTQVTDNWLKPLIETFGEYDDVGAIGPKMLFPDGRLQEAGALVNRDGTSRLIGLFDDPDLLRYNYGREVMYCSGACLLVEAKRFKELGGFDLSLAPAYCEDWDLAFQLRQHGLRVMYNPKSVIIHHLSVTSNDVEEGFKMRCVIRNQQKLSQKWRREIDNLNQIKLIAFYSPQYHQISENDRWWGKRFTEWTNVAKARPNFAGHYQPHLPADLGFYDLRVEEVMEQQAELAKQYGIYGFCYFYYRFAGKRLLDLPLERMLKTNKPNIPFCLCWANENWTRGRDGLDHEVLIAQQHSDEDDRAVIRDLMRYMRHQNYIRINGKPLLIVYRVSLFPEIKRTAEVWRDLCRKEGIGEIYLTMVESFELAIVFEHPSKYGFDASIEFPPHGMSAAIKPTGRILNSDYAGMIHDYRETILKYLQMDVPGYVRFRSVMPSWDNSPHRQNDSVMFENASPEAYQAWLEAILEQTHEQNFGDERIVFINAWNEWSEGAYLEPDRTYGHAYLQATANAFTIFAKSADPGLEIASVSNDAPNAGA